MHPGVHSRHIGEKIAYLMADTGESFSYLQLESASNQAAHLFRKTHLSAGDGIAILLDNHPAFLQICWAAQRAGLYYTPISILFQQEEVEYIINNSDARILITSPVFLDRIDPDQLSIDLIYLVDAETSNLPSKCHSWSAATATQPITPIADEMEGAEMIYSSGTTGRPKGVRFPLKKSPLGTITSLQQTRIAMHGLDETVAYLSTAPLYHSAPLRYNMLVTRLGGTAVIMRKFDAETALQLIEKHHITHSQWVPTMFNRLLKLPESTRAAYDISSLQYVIHAAAPCPVPVKEKMLKWWGPIIYEYYSGTEANGSTAISPEEWMTHKGSVGRAIHGEIHILDEAGKELPVGQVGAVYFARGSDFHYHKDPEKTAGAKNALGWSTLGDMGYLDSEGYLYLTDRASFMIISGGVNIYPQEVENLLTSHPLVGDVAVFGVPNEEFGEEVKAVIELTDPSLASEALATEIIDWCRQHLAHLKCPRSIDFINNLPRHPTGKLYKRQLRDSYWQAHHSRIV